MGNLAQSYKGVTNTDASRVVAQIAATPGIIEVNGIGNVASLALANGQLPIGVTGAPPLAATISGTANQIGVTLGAGAITLSTPQRIDTACDFVCNSITGAIKPTGLGASAFVTTDGKSALASATITQANGAQLSVDGSGMSRRASPRIYGRPQPQRGRASS